MQFLKKLILPLTVLFITIIIKFGLNFYVIFLQFGIKYYNLELKEVHHLIDKLDSILIILSISWCIITLVHILKLILLRNYDLTNKDNLKSRKVHTQVKVLEQIIIFIIILLTIGITLVSFECLKNLGVTLFASAGIAGIVIGLAAQKVIGAILAGIQIALTQPFRLEDVVIFENEWGCIEEITLTYVVVRIWDKRRLIIPSTYFIEKPFQNWTRSSSDLLVTIFIYTDYTIPFKLLREEFTRLLENTPLWDKKANVLQVTAAKETSVEIRALMSASNSPSAWNLQAYIREGLITFIQKNFPQSLPKTRITVEK